MEKAMFDIEELYDDAYDLLTEEDYNSEAPCWYEVWVIGYTGDHMVTDTEVLLNTFEDADKAVEYAKQLTLADIIRHPDVENAPIHEVDYLLIEVETVVEEEDCCANVGTIYRKTIEI
jgi:hypothetical protein